VREEDVSREQGDQNETLLLQAYMYADIFTIPKFPEHVCLTACVGLPGLPPSGPK
jgi:hypothetical protein